MWSQSRRWEAVSVVFDENVGAHVAVGTGPSAGVEGFAFLFGPSLCSSNPLGLSTKTSAATKRLWHSGGPAAESARNRVDHQLGVVTRRMPHPHPRGQRPDSRVQHVNQIRNLIRTLRRLDVAEQRAAPQVCCSTVEGMEPVLAVISAVACPKSPSRRDSQPRPSPSRRPGTPPTPHQPGSPSSWERNVSKTPGDLTPDGTRPPATIREPAQQPQPHIAPGCHHPPRTSTPNYYGCPPDCDHGRLFHCP